MTFLCRSFVMTALCFTMRMVSAELDSLASSQLDLLDFNLTHDANGCITVIHDQNPFLHKPVYRVGYLAMDGEEVAMQMYGQTFGEYLSATAGQHFDPPILFEFVPVAVQAALMKMIDAQEIDILLAPVSFVPCLATKYNADALLTMVSHTSFHGTEHDLDVKAGVMFVHKDNQEIETVADFKGKIVGVKDINYWGGGQAQFAEMESQGISPVADFKQVVTTKDAGIVIQGVLDGTFDVGFVATGEIEKYQDKNGTFVNPDNFKVINSKTQFLEDGRVFPFLSSTRLTPELPIIALKHVHETVSKEVQEALVNIEYHAKALQIHQRMLCDTTPYLAELAQNAIVSGGFARFRAPLSYGTVRTDQEVAGFLLYDEASRKWDCIDGVNLWEDLKCPPGQLMVSEELFKKSCELAGMPCYNGFECFCQPCFKAFEVDVFQFESEQNASSGEENRSSLVATQGCDKMALCGQAQQTNEITFHAIDHRERIDAEVDVLMHVGGDSLPISAVSIAPYTYEFKWSYNQVAVVVMEVFFDGEQIPESPFRVQISERECDNDNSVQGMVADEFGECQCGSDTVQIGDTCVAAATFAIVGLIVGLFILFFVTYVYTKNKNAKNDEVWQVHPDELHLLDEVIGQGSFGVVLLAEYRGTKVAIKRVLQSSKKRNGSTKRGRNSSVNNHAAVRDHHSNKLQNKENNTTVSQEETDSLNADTSPSNIATDTSGASRDNSGILMNKNGGDKDSFVSHHFSLAFMNKDMKKQSVWANLLPGSAKLQSFEEKSFRMAVIGTDSYSRSERMKQFICPWFDEAHQRREDFKIEMRVLARLRHPCITTVMGAVVTSRYDPVMIMEYMEYGSLHDLLRNETMPLTGDVILQICRDIAQGLRFLHSSKPPILHGDLKARNILIDSHFRAKLCDFGLSMKQGNELSGTPFWMAPEYLTGHKYTPACDIYSVGIILYEIYSRSSPYAGENYKEVIRGVCNRRVNKRPTIPPAMPPKFVDLMKKCWSPDVNMRPLGMGLDIILLEMRSEDAEPQSDGQTAESKKLNGDRLLYDIFPKHVVEALKKGQKIDPETHENVTVIFSDIVSFTDISRQLAPEKVCDMLDRLYVAIDSCARKHEIFKVETIGDAWMGVTNLENNQTHTHVKNIAEFAIAIVNEASKIMIDIDEPQRGFVSLRVGFHSGSVVSNVIGTLNKRYCLFGDTVNTASRMETNSAANRILCTERSYRLLRDQAPGIYTKRRGKIQVKGKGEMNVYWVGDNLLTPRIDIKEKTVDFTLPVKFECFPIDRSTEPTLSKTPSYGGDVDSLTAPTTSVDLSTAEQLSDEPPCNMEISVV